MEVNNILSPGRGHALEYIGEKRGNILKLYEIKAKSFDAVNEKMAVKMVLVLYGNHMYICCIYPVSSNGTQDKTFQ